MTKLSTLNFVSFCKLGFRLIVCLVVLSLVCPVRYAQAFEISQADLVPKKYIPADTSTNWANFSKLVNDETQKNQYEGAAYIISGALVLIGGAIGFNSAKDPAEKIAFSLSQSLAIGGMAYGAYLYRVGGDDRNFVAMVNLTPSLGESQKDELTKSFVSTRDLRIKEDSFIRAVAHGLVAGVTLLNASREKDESIRTGLWLFSGANLVASLSFVF